MFVVWNEVSNSQSKQVVFSHLLQENLDSMAFTLRNKVKKDCICLSRQSTSGTNFKRSMPSMSVHRGPVLFSGNQLILKHKYCVVRGWSDPLGRFLIPWSVLVFLFFCTTHHLSQQYSQPGHGHGQSFVLLCGYNGGKVLTYPVYTTTCMYKGL